MRVMYIHHGEITGGAPRSLRFLVNRLDREKYEPVIVFRQNEKNIEFYKEFCDNVEYCKQIKPFHCSTVSGLSIKQLIYNYVYLIPTYYAAKKLIKKYHPNIVHLNSTCLFICAKAAKDVDKRIRTICHVREPLLNNIISSYARNNCLRYCDKFIAIDEYDGRSVDFDLRKTDIIYNFVDFDVYNSRVRSDVLRKELNINTENVIFLVLARVSPENGILELVKTWKEECSDLPASLVIVGQVKGQMEEYSNKCNKVIESTYNVHILPFRNDVDKVIASSDVILCPFIEPHFSRAIIEGAAMGKPSLSRYIDGPKELIVDGITGIYYDREGLSLGHQVKYLLNNRDAIKQFGNNAESHALSNFNADVNARKTFELYK